MVRTFLAAALCGLAASSTPALEAKLGVKEPVGAERKAEPVSTGVGFKPGQVNWNRGSKWGYRVTKPCAPDDAVGHFAVHVPPKDDDILATALMFRLMPRVE